MDEAAPLAVDGRKHAEAATLPWCLPGRGNAVAVKRGDQAQADRREPDAAGLQPWIFQVALVGRIICFNRHDRNHCVETDGWSCAQV